MGGTPFPDRGYPLPSWGYPCLDLGRGLPPPHLDLGMGYPPPTWTWEGGTHPSHLDLGRGYPPLSRCGLTHKVKILPFLILRMREVKKNNYEGLFEVAFASVNEPVEVFTVSCVFLIRRKGRYSVMSIIRFG